MFLENQIVESNTNLKSFQVNLKNVQNSTSLTEEDLLESEKSINKYRGIIEEITKKILPSLEKDLSAIDSKIEEADRRCGEIKADIPWTKQFSKNEEIEIAKDNISALKEEKEQIENKIEKQEEDIQELTEKIKLLD